MGPPRPIVSRKSRLYALGGFSEGDSCWDAGEIGGPSGQRCKESVWGEGWWRLCGECVVLGVVRKDVPIDHVSVPYLIISICPLLINCFTINLKIKFKLIMGVNWTARC